MSDETEALRAHNTRRTGDERKPIGWATYSGAAHESLIRHLDSGQPMWPVEVRYDPDSDTTRVGFSLLAPADPSEEES